MAKMWTKLLDWIEFIADIYIDGAAILCSWIAQKITR